MRSINSLLTAVLATLSSNIIVNALDERSTTAYKLTDDLSYKNFFTAFDFFSEADPTDGFVQYQTRSSAISQNLVGFLEDTKSIFMGVDYKTKDPKGRASVRLESIRTWNQGLLIADIRHMPSSICGTWPAFWLLSGKNKDGKELAWPVGGEIDVLEGVNDYTINAVTLHTSTGCTVDNSTTSGQGNIRDGTNGLPFTGTMSTSDCDVAAPGQGKNVGCSIHAPSSLPSNIQTADSNTPLMPLPSYGTAFNTAGGGIYAMEWTYTFINVWFIPRKSMLYDTTFASNTTTTPDPATWGPPIAHFAGTGCDFTERFKDLKIIFDTTFCGQWAGKEWEEGGCRAKTGVQTCEAYVRDNPAAFEDAFWEVSGLKWYQKGDDAKPVVEKGAKAMRGRWFGV
ncbi:glycoside hydrolase family 16 protein [Plenodomus tracheiphilus IPT5]|uniref:endo-1,3(4)-beta-glucanase n=1 Tax=Plenodomus tracheiphilus IPT5 TaxID=1408161 RepID=A0A6A7B757_9PLEO|nr:glycoside hydrolase family 16 protein [Plenodomus tracheiphilus IPT5]